MKIYTNGTNWVKLGFIRFLRYKNLNLTSKLLDNLYVLCIIFVCHYFYKNGGILSFVKTLHCQNWNLFAAFYGTVGIPINMFIYGLWNFYISVSFANQKKQFWIKLTYFERRIYSAMKNRCSHLKFQSKLRLLI